MTNVELVKQAYQKFAEGNVPDVLSFFDPAIEWRESKGMPFVKGDGVYVGPEAVVTNVFMNLPVYFDGFKFEIIDLFGAEDQVVMAGYCHGTNKATGHSFKAHAAHVWTLKNGKLTRFFGIMDTVTATS